MKPNIHYSPIETSAPISDRSSVRSLFTLATHNDEELEHLDMESAYTNT